MSVSFEHVYDLVCTCSNKLSEELHSLGIPREKLMPIANAACISITDGQRDHARALRAAPLADRPLRCLYFGRLDHQKGVERLYRFLELVRQARLPIELRIVGSKVVGASGIDWTNKFSAFGIEIEPPVYATDEINALYLWSDVLLLPSRWEGAPLVIPECQQVGSIPLCTQVGAIDELLTNGVDGLLVENGTDEAIAYAMVTELSSLAENDDRRRALAEAAIARGVNNRWDVNFKPFRKWVHESFPMVPTKKSSARETWPPCLSQ
jgi:glycosyltransferase involved in cell wall biosynthesis